MIRQPAAMGYFYPEGLDNINAFLSSFKIPARKEKYDAFGIVSPHAGYLYSGKTAYMGFSEINIKDNIIIIGPNHTGLGSGYSVISTGEYGFGDFKIPINSELAGAIIDGKDSPFVNDELAQVKEHSIEVQIPLIYSFKKNFKIVPIVVSFMRYGDVLHVSEVITNALRDLDLLDNTLIVASSDMTHYENAESAKKKDDIAMEEILKINPESLYGKVRDFGISMCGFIPVSIMLNIAKMAGHTKAKLVNYTNSGEVSGDYSSVVGYSSIIIY